jgi:hypothetical protein
MKNTNLNNKILKRVGFKILLLLSFRQEQIYIKIK